MLARRYSYGCVPVCLAVCVFDESEFYRHDLTYQAWFGTKATKYGYFHLELCPKRWTLKHFTSVHRSSQRVINLVRKS